MASYKDKIKAVIWAVKTNMLYWKLCHFTKKTNHNLRSYKDLLKGQDIYCLGNGPSLLKEDLPNLQNKNVILTNRAYLLLDKFTPAFNAICLQDHRRIEEVREDLEKINARIFFTSATPSFVKKISFYMKRHWVYVPPKIQLIRRYRIPVGIRFDFSAKVADPLDEGVYLSETVIFFAIQLAFFLGAKRIILLGVDMNYNATNTHFTDKSIHYAPHFTYEENAKPTFQAYYKFLKNKGIELIDCTTDGRIDVLPKSSLAEIS